MSFTQNQLGLQFPIPATQGGTSLTSVGAIGNVLTSDGTTWVSSAPVAAPVSSVFGRTGAVVATIGDYSFGLISGTIAITQLPGGGVNGANELVQLTGAGALPALNASALTDLTGTLTSSVNNLNVAVNGGTPSANVTIINSNNLSLVGTTLTSSVNGIDDAVDVQPLITAPINGNFVFTNASGQVVDNGYSLSSSASDISASTIMSSFYVQMAIANQITSAKSFRGGYDASTGLFPSTGGSGTAGAVVAGDVWVVTTAGTIAGTFCDVGANLLALVNAPGQTSSNWAININGVATVFGRTGVVSAQSGDYSFGLISGTADYTQGGTGLTASGAVGNVLTSTGSGWASTAPAVASVFGRTGVVTAQSGDYSFSLISGTAVATQGGTGLTSVGAIGNVLTSDGTTWVSSAPAAAPVTSVFGRTGVVVAVTGDYTEEQIAPSFVSVTAATQTLAPNTKYYTTFAGLCVMTLPTTIAAGQYIKVMSGISGNTFQIAQNAGQSILFNSLAGIGQVTTVGTGGSLQSTAPNTVLWLECVVANTTFMVVNNTNSIDGV
jgi:hypothetical protein